MFAQLRMLRLRFAAISRKRDDLCCRIAPPPEYSPGASPKLGALA
jgi:hypothetical protein